MRNAQNSIVHFIDTRGDFFTTIINGEAVITPAARFRFDEADAASVRRMAFVAISIRFGVGDDTPQGRREIAAAMIADGWSEDNQRAMIARIRNDHQNG